MKYKKKQDVWQVRYPHGTFGSADALAKKLAKRAFVPIYDAPDESLSMGFVPVDDMDGDIGNASILAGTNMVCALRKDVRKIDKAQAKARLDREIRKIKGADGFVSRERKKEELEKIELEMMRHTFPIPTLSIVAFVPGKEASDDDCLYLPVNSETNLDAMMEVMKDVLGNPDDEYPLGDAETAKNVLANLWEAYEGGRANDFIEFTPRTVSDETDSITASDYTDLAFGMINNDKRCTSGQIRLSNNVPVGVRTSCPNALRIGILLPADRESTGDMDDLALQIDVIHETFDAVSRLFRDNVEEPDETRLREAMRTKVKYILEQA